MNWRAGATLAILLALSSTLAACGDGASQRASKQAQAMTAYLQEVDARFFWLNAEGSKEPPVFGTKELEERDLCQATRPMYAFNERLFGELTRYLREIEAPAGSGHIQLIRYAQLAHETYSNARRETDSAMLKYKDGNKRGHEALAIQKSFNYDMEHIVTPQYNDWLAVAAKKAVDLGAVVPNGIRSDAINLGVIDTSQQD